MTDMLGRLSLASPPAEVQHAGVGKAAADGLYCQAVQRKLSARLSPWLARRMGPNAVTVLGLGVGAVAAGTAFLEMYILAAVLVQGFGVLSCADGEVARIRDQTSIVGDFFDTMVDRIVEILMIGAVTGAAYREGRHGVLIPGLCLTAVVLLLVVSSEKYRSAFRVSYPKRLWEPLFSAVSAGSDGRLFVLSCGLLAAAVVRPGTALEIAISTMAAVGGLNLAWRAVILTMKLRRFSAL